MAVSFLLSLEVTAASVDGSTNGCIVQKTFVKEEVQAMAPNQVAGEILSFFTRNNFAVSDRGEVITCQQDNRRTVFEHGVAIPFGISHNTDYTYTTCVNVLLYPFCQVKCCGQLAPVAPLGSHYATISTITSSHSNLVIEIQLDCNKDGLYE
uniref:Uncharacterized protein n=1 Tax=Oryza punctata TaxID=4537 RepID=A0A0E0MFW9_ORYPU